MELAASRGLGNYMPMGYRPVGTVASWEGRCGQAAQHSSLHGRPVSPLLFPGPFLLDTAVLSPYFALHFPVSATDLEKDFCAWKCSAFAALVGSVGDSKFIYKLFLADTPPILQGAGQ